jgi:NADH dehydrogenase FAD-containing subunit
MDQPRIIIVGAGFGGLAAAKALRKTRTILALDPEIHRSKALAI